MWTTLEERNGKLAYAKKKTDNKKTHWNPHKVDRDTQMAVKTSVSRPACIHHCVCDSSKENFNVLDQVYGIKVHCANKRIVASENVARMKKKTKNQKQESEQEHDPEAVTGGSFFDPPRAAPAVLFEARQSYF